MVPYCTRVWHREITENSQPFNLDAMDETYAGTLAIQSLEGQNLRARPDIHDRSTRFSRQHSPSRDTLMSTAVKSPNPEPAHHYIVRRTVEACHLAKEAAGAAAEGIATGSAALLNSLRQRERDLDTIDMEIDAGVTTAITEVGASEARELLACMKFMIGLERIGDLLLSFASSAQAAAGRIDPEDTRHLTQMATILEKMLTDCAEAFSQREISKAIDVLRADAEMDRLRNLIFLRHIDNPENIHRQASLQVIFMTQSLERAGDHAKNLAEEVCHFVSGHTVRHVLMGYDKSVEQMFIDYLRRREEQH
jgi:phosphate transport system protein